MKKAIASVILAAVVTVPVFGCPAWECNFDINDYSCGGVHSGCVTYDESSVRQPIYCQYCGHEMWDCVCGTYSYEDYEYDEDCDEDCGYDAERCAGSYSDNVYIYDCGIYQGEGYSECSGSYNGWYSGDCYADDWDSGCIYDGTMSHWANIRDCYGQIIGQAGAGDCIEVVGTDSCNPDRVLIYDYVTGCYGSVLAECVYGGYIWDGTGDNGYYNQYRGGCENEWDISGYSDCDYNSGSCGYGNQIGTGCAAYSNEYYIQVCETVVQRCVTYGFGKFGGCF